MYVFSNHIKCHFYHVLNSHLYLYYIWILLFTVICSIYESVLHFLLRFAIVHNMLEYFQVFKSTLLLLSFKNYLILNRLPQSLSGKESACQHRRHGFDPWVGKIPGEGNGNPLQYSCLGSAMDRGAWWATDRGVTKSQI